MIRVNRKTRVAAVVGAAVLVLASSSAVAREPISPDALKSGVRASAPVPSLFVPLTPCRVLDTRSGGGGIFVQNDQGQYQVSGVGPNFALQGGVANGCGVDVANAVAVEVSVTAVTPQGNGYLRLWPSDEGMPNATFLNYSNGQSITNTGAVALSLVFQNDLRIQNFGGRTHVVIDVQGYYAAAA